MYMLIEQLLAKLQSSSKCQQATEGCVCRAQYHTKIDAIVDQAQYPGSSVEGAWFCTL